MDDLRLSNSVRRMFWCNTGHQPSVETSQLDGSGRRVLTIDKVYRPQLLALDLPVKRLYVSDTRMNSVQFCTYDGLRCHQVFAETQVILGFFFLIFRFWCFRASCRFFVWLSDRNLGRKGGVQCKGAGHLTTLWRGSRQELVYMDCRGYIEASNTACAFVKNFFSLLWCRVLVYAYEFFFTFSIFITICVDDPL